jgi:hypothetical protein
VTAPETLTPPFRMLSLVREVEEAPAPDPTAVAAEPAGQEGVRARPSGRVGLQARHRGRPSCRALAATGCSWQRAGRWRAACLTRRRLPW